MQLDSKNLGRLRHVADPREAWTSESGDFTPWLAENLDVLADELGMTLTVVATEVLVPTPAIRNLIRDGKTHQIYSALQTGGSHGMQTMDAALADLVRRQKISRELAEARASSPEELRRLMGTVRVA